MNKITRNITAILTIGLGSTLIANAQVTSQKIGTNPTMKQPSAVLEVESANKGVLMPRVTLTSITDAVTIANPANALTVFNTATAGTVPNDVTPGYYYWSSAENKWVRLIDKLPQSVNIYNADGTLTGDRVVTLGDKELTFLNTHQQSHWSIYGGLTQSGLPSSPYRTGGFTASAPDHNGNGIDSNLYLQAFSESAAQVLAGEDATSLNIGTHYTINPAPINFITSNGGGTPGTPKMSIDALGEIKFNEYPNTRDDSSTTAVENLLYTDGDGNMLSAPLTSIAVEPWLQATTEDKATLNTQNIYQNGNVGIDASTDNVFRTITPLAPLDVRGAVRGGQPLTTSAIGEYSTAFGVNNTASGFASMAWGYQYGAVPAPLLPSNTASGMAATAFGAGTIASGENATAFGLLNTASGDAALAFGSRNTASYSFSTAFGSGTLSEASAATAFGTRTHAGSLAETVFGINNAITTGNKDIRVDTDPLFQVGNGAGGLNAPPSGAEPSNALTILKNGKTAIGVAGVEAAAKPTELLDLGGTATAGNGGLKIRNINSAAYTGNITTDKVVVADTDGVLKTVPAATFAATNIYNANGSLTGNRTVNLNGKSLTFQGSEGNLNVEYGGSYVNIHGSNPDRARFSLSTDDINGNGTASAFNMSLFSDNYLQMYALGEMNGISFGTHTTLNPSPIEFITSPGANALGETRMTITGDGNIGISEGSPTEKLDIGAGNVRIREINEVTNAGNITTDKVVVADTDGVLKTVTVTSLTTPAVNIYNANGTLTGDRDVTMNSNILRFTGVDGTMKIDNTGESEFLIEAANANTARTRLIAGTSDLQISARPSSTVDISGRPGGTNSMTFGTPNDANVASKLEFYTMGITRMAVTGTGEVAIGATSAPSFTVGATTIQPKLHVAGDISTTGKVWTTNSVYADYVFEKYFKGNSDIKPDYEFKSLDYVKEFIEKEHHLPGVESIADLAKAENGYTFDMTKLTVQSLEKIEELYLHTIELKEKLDVQYQMGEQQEKMIQSQQKELEELKNRFSKLEELLIKQ